MPVFEFQKPVEDLTDAIVAESGTYTLCIQKVTLEQNKAQTGNNIVVVSNICDEADPQMNQLQFKMWLSMPNPTDEGKVWRGGVPAAEGKQKIIAAFATLVGGSAKGRAIDIPIAGKFRHVIEKKINEDTGKYYNELSGYPMAMPGTKGGKKKINVS